MKLSELKDLFRNKNSEWVDCKWVRTLIMECEND